MTDRYRPASLALVAFVLAAPMSTQDRPPATATPRVVGYLASWGVRSNGTRIADLPARELTHVFYAFGGIGRDGRAVLGNPCVDVGRCGRRRNLPARPGGTFGELLKLKARHPHLRAMISIGGWGGSARFSDVALTDSSRRRFAESAVELFIDRWPGVFDGVDVDWEFPVRGGMKGNVERPEDRENFTLLLAELRRALDARGARDRTHYELAIAASPRPSELVNLELERIAPLLDFVNIMTYDFHVASPVAHFNSPLYAARDDPTPELTVDASVRAFIAGGVPRGKLLVGVPFYGRAYNGVANVDAGRFQPVDSLPAPTGVEAITWRVLARTRLKDPRFTLHWDSSARVPWAYDAASGKWISYDDERSVRAKADYVREQELGGIVIWELGGDDGRLIGAIGDGLRTPSSTRE